ncbi:LytR C-terminal domain-containing protein, partial [Solirubrobacter deserti]
ATPAARRLEPLPPRRSQASPGRRAASPPPRREGNARGIIVTAIAAVLVIAGVGFAFTQIGGDDPENASSPTPPAGNRIEEDPTPEGGDATPEATPEPGVSKEEAQVAVLNGTNEAGLASGFRDNLVQDGYPDGNVLFGNLGEAEQTTTSTVMYARGDKSAAEGVADVLGIERVEQLSDEIQAAAVQVGQREWNVVVVIGQDKSTG